MLGEVPPAGLRCLDCEGEARTLRAKGFNEQAIRSMMGESPTWTPVWPGAFRCVRCGFVRSAAPLLREIEEARETLTGMYGVWVNATESGSPLALDAERALAAKMAEHSLGSPADLIGLPLGEIIARLVPSREEVDTDPARWDGKPFTVIAPDGITIVTID